MKNRIAAPFGILLALIAAKTPAQPPEALVDYALLATNKTSTMEKELNQAAAEGFRFSGFHGGSTEFGGREIVSVLVRVPAEAAWRRFEYALLATNRTSTLERELNELAVAGFRLRGLSAFETAFGGKEVLVVLAR